MLPFNCEDISLDAFCDTQMSRDMKGVYDIFLSKCRKSAPIYDIGSGCGRDIKYFIDNGYEVKGYERIISYAHESEARCNYRPIICEYTELQLLKCYNIWCFEVFAYETLEGIRMYLNKLYYALYPTGIVMISIPIRKNLEDKAHTILNMMQDYEFCDKTIWVASGAMNFLMRK